MRRKGDIEGRPGAEIEERGRVGTKGRKGRVRQRRR
jgi:hypothetical protein